jgi:TPR repeat protein
MNTAPQQLALEEFYLLAQHYESGSDEFVELWEVAVRMYPQDETANYNVASAAIASGDFERASRYLDKAGDSPEVTYSRGCIALGEGDYDKALALFREADERGVAEARAAVEAIESNWTARSK